MGGAYWALNYSAEYVQTDELSFTFYSFAGVIITALFSNLAGYYVSTTTVEAGLDY